MLEENVTTYFALAREREAIRRRRAAGQPWPWTEDPIFQTWRFCNVRREDDATTVWLREHVRSKLDGLRLVEAVAIFRWFNRIETGERILDLLRDGWDRDEAYRRLSTVNGPLWTGAYRIRGANGVPKLDSTLDSIEVARRRLPTMVPRWGQSLRGAWLDLTRLPFIGALMGYEIASDLRWTPVLASAEDINTWAAAGPGCANGLAWLRTGRLGTNDSAPKEDPALIAMMRALLALSRDESRWPYPDAPWEMREVEHWACETAKAIRVRNRGKLRQRFRPPPPPAPPSIFDLPERAERDVAEVG